MVNKEITERSKDNKQMDSGNAWLGAVDEANRKDNAVKRP